MQLRERRRVARAACILVAALSLLITVASCGGDDSSDAFAKAGVPESPPKVEVPAGLPPKKLVYKDLAEGTGTEAKKGDRVALQYNCVVWEHGGEYSNSWRYQRPPVFVLGGGRQLQRGLDLAVRGMKEGGGREVLVPHTLLYYPDMSHPPAGRLAALICKVYVVDVLGEKRRS